MTYTKEQVEAALAEAENIKRVLRDNHPTVILASALRDAWAERDRLRTTGTGYFHQNFRGHRPIPGEPLERITMIDTGLRLEAERDRLRAALELSKMIIYAESLEKEEGSLEHTAMLSALLKIDAALAGKGE